MNINTGFVGALALQRVQPCHGKEEEEEEEEEEKEEEEEEEEEKEEEEEEEKEKEEDEEEEEEEESWADISDWNHHGIANVSARITRWCAW
jgi:hypothetical protein